MKCSWDEKIKKMNWMDLQFVKLSAIFGGLVIFKAVKIIWGWDVFSVSIWWLLVIMLVLAIKPIVKAYSK